MADVRLYGLDESVIKDEIRSTLEKTTGFRRRDTGRPYAF